MDIRCRTIELIGVLLLASVVQAQSVDWTRQCIDGVRLTGNYDRRYLGYDPPLDAKVEGKPNADAAGLFDSYGKTKLTWAGGEDVSITLDFRVPRLVSGVELILPAGRQRDWRLSVSRDGAAWHPIPAARRFAVAGMVAVDEDEVVDEALDLIMRFVGSESETALSASNEFGEMKSFSVA